jgi:Ca2+-binding RTX toxin-like protein
MKRWAAVAGATGILLASQLTGVAVAQDEPLCGPPGEEQPATIVGSGTIVGTSGNDVIVGSDEADTIHGLSGDDVICGRGGNNWVDGGQGSDVLIGGEDLPPFAESDGTNDDTLLGSQGDDLMAGLSGDDNLSGGQGDDQIIGMGGDDTVTGGSGADTAFGGPGVDSVSGDQGADTLWGNFGSDSISGGSGADFIDGDNPFPVPPELEDLPFDPGGNEDVCTGGSGADTLLNCETSTP